MRALLGEGELYSARRHALARVRGVTDHLSFAPAPPLTFDPRAAAECAQEWSLGIDNLLSRQNYSHLIHKTHQRYRVEPVHLSASPYCSNISSSAHEWWESCCSSLSESSIHCPSPASLRACFCPFSSLSRSFLRIPAIRELWVRVRLFSGNVIHLEQVIYACTHAWMSNCCTNRLSDGCATRVSATGARRDD